LSVLTTRTTGGINTVTLVSGGSGYTAPPTVSFGSGTGVAIMAGTRVSGIAIISAGTGNTSAQTISFTGGGGTGAAGTAYAFAGSTVRPMCFFRDRKDWLYGVDGMGRGIRISPDATTSVPLGIHPPSVGPVATTSSTTGAGRVTAVQIINSGVGYSSAPEVQFSGGTPSRPATAVATVFNGRVTAVRVQDSGAGYLTTPTVTMSGGMANAAAFSLGVAGKVASVDITSHGSGYTSNATTNPTIQFSTGQGLTGVAAVVNVDQLGRVDGIRILSGGTGATTTGVTATIVGGGGTGAVVGVQMQYAVNAVTVSASGQGFKVAPVLTFTAATDDASGRGASAVATVNSTGNISAVTVISGGQYSKPPTCAVADTTAKAQATMAKSMAGAYRCCIRFTDSTEESMGGPIPSSISELVEVDSAAGAGTFTWALPATALDARVTHVELWRTTADQSVILFRVARLTIGTTSYSDSFSDDDLTDTARADYGLMPVTMPSGQINARRFGVPPGNFAVACMFQDRAWYAVDTIGARPNALMYSEIDEPESVPTENELLLQENVTEKDEITALIPLGPQLVVAQKNHLYKLTYVAQPILDASFMLSAHRGVLHNRCWGILSGVAFLVDSQGMYAYDGSQVDAISVPVDNYWRDRIIDFSKSASFHVHADTVAKVIRFYYCRTGDSLPVRALCFCVATKAWWEETYPAAVTTACNVVINGRREQINGTAGGAWKKHSGLADEGNAIAYEYRSGPMPLVNEQGDRSVTILYQPTSDNTELQLRLHYNGSSSPRANAITTDRGVGFTTTGGSTQAVLNMNRQRSALGDATGEARAHYAGRVDDRSSGGDRHVAVALGGTQAATAPVTIYGISVSGASA
jgi:hypothetical protein